MDDLEKKASFVGVRNQIRFYSLFLLALCISLWAFAECVTKPSRPKFFWLALANLFLLTTHALSLLLIAFEALAVALWSGWPSRGGRRLWLGILCGIAALVLLLFMFRETAFSWFAAYTDSTATYTGSRGLSVTQFAKIPLTLFFFIVGTSIYPLDYFSVVPSVMIYAGAVLVGWFNLGRWHRVWRFVSLVIAGGLGILYLVLDALIPPSFAGAGPRYLVFMVPLFYLLAAAGTMPRASFQINSGVPIQAVELKRTGSTGDFSVWAVRLEPKYAANGRN